MVVHTLYAQSSKPKTLKELIAEEKAQKEAEKKAKASQESRGANESGTSQESRDAQSPEEAADFVTETDSALWAPTQVKQLGFENFGSLSAPSSSMDLQNPNNISTTVEYQPETGTYIIRTKIGDTDVTTPYMLTQDEYNQYAERQLMHRYWQQKIGEVEHNNEKKFDITDMTLRLQTSIYREPVSYAARAKQQHLRFRREDPSEHSRKGRYATELQPQL